MGNLDSTWPSMLPAQRQDEILGIALREGVVRISEMAGVLGVHEATIRRDIDALVDRGLLVKVRGGARLLDGAAEEVSYRVRSQKSIGAKKSIAIEAARLVQDGDVIGLDSSTTALALAWRLAGRTVSVVTTGFEAASVLAEAGLPFVLVGGTYHVPARSFVGPVATRTLKTLRMDKVFFSAKGISAEGGLTDAYPPEVDVKAHMLQSGRQRIVLIDSSKFDRDALLRICDLEAVDTIITDRPLDEAIERALKIVHVDIQISGRED